MKTILFGKLFSAYEASPAQYLALKLREMSIEIVSASRKCVTPT